LRKTEVRAKGRRAAWAALLALGLCAAGVMARAPSAMARQGDPAAQSSLSIGVLSAADVARYKEIFALEEDGRTGEADRKIDALENPLLVGHVLAQRYTAEGVDRPRYGDLRDWLERYADLPEAPHVYALALKLKPKSRKIPMPDRPEARIWRPRAHDREDSVSARSSSPKVLNIHAHIRELVRDERPSEALAYLRKPKTAKLMGTNDRDDALAFIASSYLAEGVADRAYEVASEVAERNRREVPGADWTAGLAAWRLGKRDVAARHFEALAAAPTLNRATRAAGAFWAARAYLTTHEPARVATLLEKAAETPRSFYGVLALRALGRDLAFEWRLPQLDQADFQTLTADPGIARAVALWQIGEDELAQAELFRAHGRLAAGQDTAFLALAGVMNLPAVEIEATECLSTTGFDAGRYPVPNYAPEGGFTLDKALLYAFMRQESRFKTSAESGAGARGLMQLMPKTASIVAGDKSLAKRGKERLLEPAMNLQIAQIYLERLMRAVEPQGNLFMLAIAYNGGPGNLKRWRENLGIDDDPLLFIESIPVAETRDYIERVLTNYWAYRSRFGESVATLDETAAGEWPVYRN
jgi:soluble lytic murein transglycosylase-like protein